MADLLITHMDDTWTVITFGDPDGPVSWHPTAAGLLVKLGARRGARDVYPWATIKKWTVLPDQRPPAPARCYENALGTADRNKVLCTLPEGHEGDHRPWTHPDRCSQCGQAWDAWACGPTHAVIAAELGVERPERVDQFSIPTRQRRPDPPQQ